MNTHDLTYSGTSQDSGCSASDLRSALQELFLEPISSVIERESSKLDQLLAACAQRCVLFGAGSFGRQALAALRGIGVVPVAMTDNNSKLWGTTLESVPVLSPADAARLYSHDAVFFITIRNENHFYLDTVSQLEQLGCTRVSSADPIAWRFPGSLQPALLYDLPHKLYENSDQVFRAAELWGDDLSRSEYLGNIRLRALGDRSWFRRPDPLQSYFPEDLFHVDPADFFVDCGAFDGDTIRALLLRQKFWGGIAAVEADFSSFQRLRAYVETLDITVRERIHLYHCAIGERCGKVCFEDSGVASSTTRNEGGTVVDMMPIDMLFADTTVSIVKMDIEGAEMAGLMGARKVIERDRPILAICAYHKQEDIFELPLLIRDLDSDYRLYLRTHGGDGIQTVAYAIPAHRGLTT